MLHDAQWFIGTLSAFKNVVYSERVGLACLCCDIWHLVKNVTTYLTHF